jgi:pimeloyl-ACP methyl ester carboxylesterase
MDVPETRYTRSGDVHIAYQVFGGGAVDLVFLAEFWNSIEAMWEQPDRFLERLGSFARVICIDQRGTGSSDPVSLSELPTLEVWADDVITTMKAVGSDKAAILGVGGGGGVGMLFAATFPERVSALALLNTTARYTATPDYPWGTSREFEARLEKELEFGWGRGVLLETVGPNVAGDPAFRRWWARYQRLGSSPGTVLAMRHMLQQLDVRHVLPSIGVPTLVISRRDNRLVEAVPGDGFLVTFDGPARAIRGAVAVRDEVRALGLEICAGLHTGEVELAKDGVRGIAVHTGARVAGDAGPGQILVSSTVKDLVAGSGIAFEDRGAHALKGVPEAWRLYEVVNA